MLSYVLVIPTAYNVIILPASKPCIIDLFCRLLHVVVNYVKLMLTEWLFTHNQVGKRTRKKLLELKSFFVAPCRFKNKKLVAVFFAIV